MNATTLKENKSPTLIIGHDTSFPFRLPLIYVL